MSNVAAFLVAAAILVATTVWVGIDSASMRRNGIDTKPPGLWVLECLVLWIVVFPWYLIRRQRRMHRAYSTEVATSPETPPSSTTPVWPPPPPPGWVPPTPQPQPLEWAAPDAGTRWPPQATTGPPPASWPGPPRRAYTWWIIVLIVLGGVLALFALLGLFADQTLVTLDHQLVECGSVIRPQQQSLVSAAGTTCATERSRLLTGAIVIWVVSAGMIVTALAVAHARAKKMRRPTYQQGPYGY